MKRRILMLGLTVLLIVGILSIANVVKAVDIVQVTRDVYSNNGSMKFNFSGLTLDTTKEYEFGLTKTVAATVENWTLITEYTATTATVNVITTNEKMREVVNSVDTGYITIREKATSEVALPAYAVDLKIPFLRVSNFTVISNGKEYLAGGNADNGIQIALRNAKTSKAYYQYEKITDQNVINQYKEIKAKNGNYLQLQNSLKTIVPTSNWQTWEYWNGHDSNGMDGFGYTQRTISAPNSGLYYMWLYFSGDNLKDMYGYILVDNLQPEISLESIALPKALTLPLNGKLTLTPVFNPSNATNKIVTWTSSDETVATVSNAGKLTPKKEGSTIITVTSQDGNKKATCTITVTKESSNNQGNTGNSGNTGNQNTGNNTTDKGNTNGNKDNTVAPGKMPQAGISQMIILVCAVIAVVGTVVFVQYKKLKDI